MNLPYCTIFRSDSVSTMQFTRTVGSFWSLSIPIRSYQYMDQILSGRTGERIWVTWTRISLPWLKRRTRKWKEKGKTRVLSCPASPARVKPCPPSMPCGTLPRWAVATRRHKLRRKYSRLVLSWRPSVTPKQFATTTRPGLASSPSSTSTNTSTLSAPP
uniref:Uncharacterized protein n=1 Tax=Cacopsylla melanoneura TaxID=428564 RepID=A0A8D8X144_9HEMI